MSGAATAKRAEDSGRVNMFYELESNALSTNLGNRPFIAVPPAIPKQAQSIKDLQGLEPIQWTYKQVYDVVLQYAEWLKTEHGVHRGDIVAMSITNRPVFIFLWFAIWSLGAKAAFINTGLREEALVHCVKASSARILVVDASIQDAFVPEIRSHLSSAGVAIAIVDAATENSIQNLAGYRAPDKDRDGDRCSDLSVLIFTSGTTGLPKPAIVPWKKFYNSSKAMSVWMNVKPTDRYYTVR